VGSGDAPPVVLSAYKKGLGPPFPGSPWGESHLLITFRPADRLAVHHKDSLGSNQNLGPLFPAQYGLVRA
jgi:hypothetical protein